jgi:muconolactone delta-isomerase
MNLYMTEITLPAYLSHELIELIPAQRAHIDKLLQENVVLSYTLAADRSKLWVVVSAKNAASVDKLIAAFPIAEYVQWDITELAFHNSVKVILPTMSLN